MSWPLTLGSIPCPSPDGRTDPGVGAPVHFQPPRGQVQGGAQSADRAVENRAGLAGKKLVISVWAQRQVVELGAAAPE